MTEGVIPPLGSQNLPDENTEEDLQASREAPVITTRIDDTRSYLRELELGGGRMSPLDRSKFYRYRQDIEELRKFAREHEGDSEPLSLAIIGCGNGEEPLSYLSALTAELPPGKNLNDRVRLHIIEVRPKEDISVQYGWGKVSKGGVSPLFLEGQEVPLIPRQPPKDLRQAFQLDESKGEYVFRDDIQSVMEKTMHDPQRGHFETPIENHLADYPNQMYAVVACNNVLQHLGAGKEYPTPYRNPDLQPEAYARFTEVVRGILQCVQPGGLLILHTDGANIMDAKGHASEKALQLVPEFDSEFTEVATGVFRRNGKL